MHMQKLFFETIFNNFYTKIKLFSFTHISDVCKQKADDITG